VFKPAVRNRRGGERGQSAGKAAALVKEKNAHGESREGPTVNCEDGGEKTNSHAPEKKKKQSTTGREAGRAAFERGVITFN